MKKFSMGLLALVLVSIFCLSISLNVVAADKKIDFWHIRTGDLEDILLGSIERFEEDYPEYDVEVTKIQPGENQTKVQVAVGGGNPPDIFRTQGGGSFKPYVNAGEVLNLTDLLEESGYINRFPESAFEAVKYDGKIYAVPANGSSAAMIWYNTEIFNKYDIDVPETWEEFKEVMVLLQDKGYETPISLANRERWPASEWFEYLVMRVGGDRLLVNAANNNNDVYFTNEAFAEAGAKLQELVEMGAFNKGFNSTSYDLGESRRLLYTEQAVMTLMGNWEYQNMLSENPEWAERIDYITFPEVKGGSGDPSSVLGMPAQDYYTISSKSDDIDIAFELLQYVYDEEATEARAKAGNIPPVIGSDKFIENPITSKLQADISNANFVQQWGDKLMDPQLAEKHQDLIQKLLSLDITPEEYGKEMEETRKEIIE